MQTNFKDSFQSQFRSLLAASLCSPVRIFLVPSLPAHTYIHTKILKYSTYNWRIFFMNAKRIQLSQISYMHVILSYIHTYIYTPRNNREYKYINIHAYSTHIHINIYIHSYTYIHTLSVGSDFFLRSRLSLSRVRRYSNDIMCCESITI
jgi:hypothetical protein